MVSILLLFWVNSCYQHYSKTSQDKELLRKHIEKYKLDKEMNTKQKRKSF